VPAQHRHAQLVFGEEHRVHPGSSGGLEGPGRRSQGVRGGRGRDAVVDGHLNGKDAGGFAEQPGAPAFTGQQGPAFGGAKEALRTARSRRRRGRTSATCARWSRAATRPNSHP
jgi:hypothetical protein